jgi:hypothetical protein
LKHETGDAEDKKMKQQKRQDQDRSQANPSERVGVFSIIPAVRVQIPES